METIRYHKEDIQAVVKQLKQKKVIAFPTDTVYGLGVIYDEEALAALKYSKGRPENKPIPTMVGSLAQMEEIAVLNEEAKKLVAAFMPGAFTMILKKKDSVADFVTNGMETIGIRMPQDDFVLELLRQVGSPMLVTSANLSGEATGLVDVQVLSQLDGRIDGIVLGEAGGKVASTIVDMTSGKLKILREGPISKAMLEAALKK
ncbi:MAG: threonylcarbamoyl-AMP synthase [Amedibacillus dolichus]|uniref:L-threonylcarbamoyladenylate synthase n=1 Tax=Amedibacillus dolichus TaxID=31971 RepID=A0A415PEC3_9FIRM|nr:L-threonylcarbamoyladenylate synthase [Amedibacillus dolichus]PWL65540.1 MAG: threonylcarbamoyl-AMP synthase [Amedibacillus dolichus]RHM11102.1 threonylcarbamoyl-AMP synthase [Amedibacillus dolichus]